MKTNCIIKNFITFALCLFLSLNISIINSNSLTFNKITFGKDALKHVEQLSKTPRISGSKSIINSQKYIKNEFQKYGYNVYEQNFEWPIKNQNKLSKNLIAHKKGLNKTQIIIGAHYDSSNSNGADDNASGIGVLLELSEKLSKIVLPYTIKFIAFDAEELGLFGSRFFVKNMSEEEKSNTILYINIDSILSGDDLYIYGDNGARGWFRDQILELSNKENMGIKTSPGLKSDYVSILEGECFDYSDHVYFRQEGIPFAYFESTNWESFNEQTGYPNYRNSDLGMIIHSNNDNLDYILKNLKSKPIENLNKTLSLLYKALTSNNTITITTNIENNSALNNIYYELYKNNNLIQTFNNPNSNKIVISNLKKGKYKIKQINNTNIKTTCNMDDKFFEISENGNFHLLYEDINLIPKTKEYDGMLIKIYGEDFNDPQSYLDELYKNFLKIKNLDPNVIYEKKFSINEMENVVKENNKVEILNESSPAFLNFDSNDKEDKEFNNKKTLKIMTSILLTFLYSNIYILQKSKSI